MFHVVHVVHVHLDPRRVAALVQVICWAVAAWLAWTFLPEGWPAASAWLGHACDMVLAPVAGLLGVISGTLRFLVTAQAVLLPVWALLLGAGVGLGDLEHAPVLWFGLAGLDAICALALGYPVLALMIAAGSPAALWAACAADLSLRDWTGWLAASVAGGLSAWGSTRYGTGLGPVCWLLVPASWVCLALGAAYGSHRHGGGRSRDGGAMRLLLLACALAVAAAGPFASDAARAAGFLAGISQPAPVQPVLTAAGHAPTDPGAPGAALPARQPAPPGASRGSGRDGKPAGALHPTRPRT